MLKKITNQTGATFIDMLIAISVAGILIITLTIITGRVFGVRRIQVEQGAITEDARLQIERVSKTIRNSRSCSGYRWLQVAGPNSIEVITKVDNGPDIARVGYYLGETGKHDTELIRSVQPLDENCLPVGSPQVQTVIRSVRNVDHNRARIFSYLKSDGSPATLNEVALIRISLFIDVDTKQLPKAAEVSTEVSLRNQ